MFRINRRLYRSHPGSVSFRPLSPIRSFAGLPPIYRSPSGARRYPSLSVVFPDHSSARSTPTAFTSPLPSPPPVGRSPRRSDLTDKKKRAGIFLSIPPLKLIFHSFFPLTPFSDPPIRRRRRRPGFFQPNYPFPLSRCSAPVSSCPDTAIFYSTRRRVLARRARAGPAG